MNIINWFSQKREKALREQVIQLIGGICIPCLDIFCQSRRVNPEFKMAHYACKRCSNSAHLAFQYFLTQEIQQQVLEQNVTLFNLGSWPVLVNKMDDGYVVIFPYTLIPRFHDLHEKQEDSFKAAFMNYAESSINALVEPRLPRGFAALLAGYSNTDVADYIASVPKEYDLSGFSQAVSVTNASGKSRRSELSMIKSGLEVIQSGDNLWNVPCYLVRIYS